MTLGRPKRSKDVVENCVVCGKELVRPEYDRPRRFCSRACFHKPGPHRPSKGKREPEQRECAYCKKPFLAGGRGHRKLAGRYCSRGCATAATHPFKGGSLPGENLVGYQKPGYERSFSPTLLAIAWAAGIYEGEGTALRAKAGRGSEHVAVVQKDPWILYRLAMLFGGHVSKQRTRPKSINGGPVKDYGDIYCWFIGGARARGFLMTIFTFLSPRRREQARVALGHAPRVVED
jgi:hypothetical protein